MNENNTLANDNVTTFLTFILGKEIFATNVKKVLTILEMRPITKVPNSPEYMRGVINLRGNVLPVIDMRIKFGMSPTQFTDNTCIIVLNVTIEDEELQLGILVDAVDKVLELKESEIEESPSIGTKYKVEFIQGMYKLEDGFIMLLNMDLIFNSEVIILAKENESVAIDE
ncbi:MAG: purine-binding chemotaxis protein CheW [Salinivirgaceae bacterium]|nr:purine-binding chemotaxis protein CheW [Salinivirgaceae bacterium]